MAKKQYSISPSGEKFPLPGQKEYRKEFDRLKRIVSKQRKDGKEIVVVVGVGFVGAVMAAVVADATDKKGRPNKFVIGMQRTRVIAHAPHSVVPAAETLIGSEDDQSFLLQPEAIKGLQYLAYSVVHAAHLGSISPDCGQVAYVLPVLAKPGVYRFAWE